MSPITAIGCMHSIAADVRLRQFVSNIQMQKYIFKYSQLIRSVYAEVTNIAECRQ